MEPREFRTLDSLGQENKAQLDPQPEKMEGFLPDSSTRPKVQQEEMEGISPYLFTEPKVQPEDMGCILGDVEMTANDHPEVPCNVEADLDTKIKLQILDGLSTDWISMKYPAVLNTCPEVTVSSTETGPSIKPEGTITKTEGLHFPSISSELERIPKYSAESSSSQIELPISANGNLNVATNPEKGQTASVVLKPKKTRQKSIKTAQELHKRRWNLYYQKLDVPANSNVQNVLQKTQSNIRNRKIPKAPLGILQSLMNNNSISKEKKKDHPNPDPEYKGATKIKHLEELLKVCPKTNEKTKYLLDAQALDEAVDRFGTTRTKKLTPTNGKWLVHNVKTALYNHQVIGADFMISREFCPDGLTGGICADGMGLGKTLQTLVTMVVNKPVKKDTPRRCRTTLLVVPCSMTFQWESEIQKHTPEAMFPRVIIYDAKKEKSVTRVTDCDIVITTYAEVARSCHFPDDDTLRDLKKAARQRVCGISGGPKIKAADDDSQAQEDWIREHQSKGGFLHQIEWNRIVLDEAHAIKNHLSRTSLAVRTLKGKYRWCLSGTPVMNNLEELFPYLQFLRDPDSKNLRMFRAKYCNQKKAECNERLDDILSKIMINRSMKDIFLGKPIIDLPAAHEAILRIEFNPPEQILYRAVEGNLRKVVNDKLQEMEELNKAGDSDDFEVPQSPGSGQKAKDKESFMLVQLIRLRQMTAHPLLIESEAKKIFDIAKLKAIQQEIIELGTDDLKLHDHIGTWVAEKEKRVKQGLSEYDSEDDDDEDMDMTVCPLCNDEFSDPVLIPFCKHSFCRSCIESWAEKNISGGAEEPPCPSCRQPFDVTKVKVARVPKGTKLHGKSKKSTMGRDATGFVPHVTQFQWLHRLDSGDDTLLQSSKMKALIEQLRIWLKEVPSEKFIFFTQWIPFATIIGRALQRIGVQFVYFTGDMTVLKRKNSITKFETDSEVKIMIATLKTAGVGLNLAFASRVISFERQAFGRVYRIGQEKETHFVRIIINDSIDARMLAMQEKKMKLVSDIMSPRLSVVDMASLLGHVVKENGSIRIQADYNGHDPMDLVGDSAEDDDESEYGGSFIDDDQDDDGSDVSDSELDD